VTARLKCLGPRADLLAEMRVDFLLEPQLCLMPTRRGSVPDGRLTDPCQAGHLSYSVAKTRHFRARWAVLFSRGARGSHKR
jgi:hypothetical protein